MRAVGWVTALSLTGCLQTPSPRVAEVEEDSSVEVADDTRVDAEVDDDTVGGPDLEVDDDTGGGPDLEVEDDTGGGPDLEVDDDTGGGPDADTDTSACPEVPVVGGLDPLTDLSEVGQRRVGNGRVAVTLAESLGWMPTVITGPSGSGVDLLFDEAVTRERGLGVLLFDEASLAESPSALTTVVSGPAMVHVRKVADGVLGATTDLVIYADGRLHMSHRVVIAENGLNEHWLVAHAAIPIGAVSRVQMGPRGEIDLGLPSGRTSPGGVSFLGGETGLDLGPRPYLCAYDAATGDAVALMTNALYGRAEPLARVTESAAGASSVHSVRLQFDWARGNVPAATYTGEFMFWVDGVGSCESAVRWSDAFDRPPGLTVTRGELVLGPGDVDRDGYVEGLGHYRVSGSQRGVDLSLGGEVPGLALRVDGDDFAVASLRVFVDGVERCLGDYLAQQIDSGVVGGMVLLRGPLAAGSALTLRW